MKIKPHHQILLLLWGQILIMLVFSFLPDPLFMFEIGYADFGLEKEYMIVPNFPKLLWQGLWWIVLPLTILATGLMYLLYKEG